jgi:hypothetical protein
MFVLALAGGAGGRPTVPRRQLKRQTESLVDPLRPYVENATVLTSSERAGWCAGLWQPALDQAKLKLYQWIKASVISPPCIAQ